MPLPDIRFCRRCGSAVQQRVPPGEDRLRAVCPRCAYVDYVNPTIVVGTVPVAGAERLGAPGAGVLLCRRAIEPRHGLWTLPAGFLEIGESLAEGAARETHEEAGAHIELGEVYSLIDVVHVAQVHVFFAARLLDAHLDPGVETLEARVFPITQIPWGELAFRTVRRTLEWVVADHAAGALGRHTDVLR